MLNKHTVLSFDIGGLQHRCQLTVRYDCRVAGNCLGYISSFFYLLSRASQIFKNWQRSATEGLSLSMFACTITANLFYGAGIIVRAESWDALAVAAPWLLGSLGTVGLDLTIFAQVCLIVPHPLARDTSMLLSSMPNATGIHRVSKFQSFGKSTSMIVGLGYLSVRCRDTKP